MNHAYIRVSGTQQSLSLEEQQNRIRRYAEYKGIEIAAWYVDEHISGGRRISSRPKGHALCCALENGDTVICTQLDRVFRNLADGILMEAEWTKRDIAIVAVDDGGQAINTDTVTGWLCFTQRLMYAEMERRLASDRTKKIKEAARNRGEHVSGHVKYGWRRTKHNRKLLEPDPEEQGYLEVMTQMRDSGKTYPEIAAELNRLGSKTRTGGKWYPNTTRQVLARVKRDERAFASKELL